MHDNQLIKTKTPEELELGKKQGELNNLGTELAQKELQLATLQAELNVFEQRYIRIIGSRYAKLDEVQALYAEVQARINPSDTQTRERARQAREQAQESAQTVQPNDEDDKKTSFKPSENLRNLYRQVAKMIHPDLSDDEAERVIRQELMAEANRAYEEGNESKLNEILSEWNHSPASVRGEGVASELVRTIRKIAQVGQRLRVIQMKIAELEKSDLNQLKTKGDSARRTGKDLLVEMANSLDEKIEKAGVRLSSLILEWTKK